MCHTFIMSLLLIANLMFEIDLLAHVGFVFQSHTDTFGIQMFGNNNTAVLNTWTKVIIFHMHLNELQMCNCPTFHLNLVVCKSLRLQYDNNTHILYVSMYSLCGLVQVFFTWFIRNVENSKQHYHRSTQGRVAETDSAVLLAHSYICKS